MRLIVFIVSSLLAQLAAAEPLKVGQIAPNWMLTGLDNETVLLYDEAESGNTTVMVFWTSWCHSCQVLLPGIEKLKKRAGERPIKFYALNIWDESSEDEQTAETPPAKKHVTSLKVLPKAENVAERFNVKGTPGIIVVGPDKQIKYIRQQVGTKSGVIDQLASVLNISMQ